MRAAFKLARMLTGNIGIAAILMVGVTSSPNAGQRSSSATMFDPNPTALLFPITANSHDAREFAFGGARTNRRWMSFSSDVPRFGGNGFNGVPTSTGPGTRRSKAKAPRALPIGCEALGSIKSPLGRLIGRCMASL